MSCVTSFTFDTLIAGLQVSLELLETWSGEVKLRIRNPNTTLTSTRTTSVRDRQNVAMATEIAEILVNARAEMHSPVQGRRHDNDGVVVTTGLEDVILAVVLLLCIDRQNLNISRGMIIYEI